MSVYKVDSRGKRIAWARKQAGLTGHELARATGVRNVTISYIENDHRPLSLSLLLKIAEVTGVTVGFILMETDEPYRVTPTEQEPVYFSPEADQSARLIDAASPDERARMLAVLRAMAETALTNDCEAASDRRNKRVISEPVGQRRLILGQHLGEKREGTRA